jgi:phospholipid/cholesterol/gamma-HCH transport system substrate-binding protein
MEYRRTEIRAGIFLLLSFAILVTMVFVVSDIQSLFKKKKEVKALFLFSDGIEKNAQVRLSGIKVGKVADIRVAPEFTDKIELTLSIFSDTVIRQDAKAAIKSLGLVGGKYVELTGGTPKAPLLEPGGMITGEESFKLEDLTKAALDVVGKLKNIATNLDHMLGDPALAKSLKTTIQNLQEVSANVKDMTSHKEEVAQTLKNVEDMTSHKEEVAQTLKNLPVLLKKIDENADNLKALTEKSDKLLDDNKKNIDEMIANFRDISKNMKDMTEEVKKAPWKLLRKP